MRKAHAKSLRERVAAIKIQCAARQRVARSQLVPLRQQRRVLVKKQSLDDVRSPPGPTRPDPTRPDPTRPDPTRRD